MCVCVCVHSCVHSCVCVCGVCVNVLRDISKSFNPSLTELGTQHTVLLALVTFWFSETAIISAATAALYISKRNTGIPKGNTTSTHTNVQIKRAHYFLCKLVFFICLRCYTSMYCICAWLSLRCIVFQLLPLSLRVLVHLWPCLPSVSE